MYRTLPKLTAQQNETLFLGGPAPAAEVAFILGLNMSENWDIQCKVDYGMTFTEAWDKLWEQVEDYLTYNPNALISNSSFVRVAARKKILEATPVYCD